MFIIIFSIFTFILTVFEKISLSVITLGIILLGIVCYRRITHRDVRKYFLLILLAFSLSLGSFLRNNFDTIKSSVSHSLATSFKKGGIQSKSFFGTGIIQDTSTAGKYIFTTSAASYILQSKQTHQIGEELFLVGRRSSGAYSGIQEDQSFLAFDYTKRLKMKGLAGVIYETNSSIINNGGTCFARQTFVTANEKIPSDQGKDALHASQYNDKQDGCSGPVNQAGRIKQIKKSLQQKVISFYGKNKISGLILGMLIGDRSLIPADDYKGFINSGLVHLIAVSGGNLVMITVFLGLILFFLPFYLRSGVILLAIIFYALLCGLDSSVFRAVITGGLSLLALFRGKEIPIWRLLSMAFIAMLIINPYYLVYDVGFLMSFAAVIGIIYISQKKKVVDENPPLRIRSAPPLAKEAQINENKSRYSLLITRYSIYIWKNYLQPSVGATMGVFPIIIFFMGQLNLLSIIGNLFVLPIVPFVMIYGFISVFLFQLLHRQRILLIEKFLILYIYKVSEISSTFGLFLSMSGWVKRMVLLGFLGWFIWKRMKKNKEKDMAGYTNKPTPTLPGQGGRKGF